MRKAVVRIVLVAFMFSTASLVLAADRNVELTASDGTKLKATFLSASKPGPGVLLLHQCNRGRQVWYGLADQLHAAGMNVLMLDYRGFGESGDIRRDKATPQQAAAEQAKWPGDIDLAFRYLITQPGVTRDAIGVGGASCGVDNSIQAAIRHPEVRSLVLLSGATDYRGRQFLRSDTRVPGFFAFADDDEFPPTPIMIQWLYTITADSGKKLVHYTNGGHGSDMFQAHPELMGLITEWYVTTLIKTLGQAPATKDTSSMPQEAQVLNLIDEPKGAAQVQAQLEEARQRDPKATLFPEALVNIMGYEHLQSGDVKGAVAILKLNAVAYPNSPNVYDSLGDAYVADGQKALARENSKKALEMMASDATDNQQRKDAIKASAEAKLKQLGDGDRSTASAAGK